MKNWNFTLKVKNLLQDFNKIDKFYSEGKTTGNWFPLRTLGKEIWLWRKKTLQNSEFPLRTLGILVTEWNSTSTVKEFSCRVKFYFKGKKNLLQNKLVKEWNFTLKGKKNLFQDDVLHSTRSKNEKF